MNYKPGHKIIIDNKLYKIDKVYPANFYSCCNEEGCARIVLDSQIHQSYIGKSDPEYYYSAKIIYKEATKLLEIAEIENNCDLEVCKNLEEAIDISKKLMETFKYSPS